MTDPKPAQESAPPAPAPEEKEKSPAFRLGVVSMAARLYLLSGHPADRALLVELVNAEIPYLVEIPE